MAASSMPPAVAAEDELDEDDSEDERMRAVWPSADRWGGRAECLSAGGTASRSTLTSRTEDDIAGEAGERRGRMGGRGMGGRRTVGC